MELNKFIPEPWRSFLGELDAAIETEVRLDCIGGFVVTLVYGFSRPTADLDVLEIRKPIIVDGGRLARAEFEKVKIAETIETREGKSCRPIHSPLWQADSDKIRRNGYSVLAKEIQRIGTRRVETLLRPVFRRRLDAANIARLIQRQP